MLPRVEPVTAPGGGGAGAGAQAGMGAQPSLSGRRLDASAAELEIDGLRAYREGAPASRIHWPSVARHGEMLERRLVAELDSAPLIVMDPSGPADEEALDKAVRAAASLCLWLARTDGCAVLLPGDRRPIDISHDLGSWPAVHARLALVEEGAAPAGGVLGPRGGAVIWVTGADLHATPRALERLPAGSRYVVAPGVAARSAGRVRGGWLHRLPRRARSARHRLQERGMSGVLGRSPAPATAGAPPAPSAARAPPQRSRATRSSMRLIAFAALGAFGAAHWGLLVKDPPVGRTLLVHPRGHRRRRRARAAQAGRAPAPGTARACRPDRRSRCSRSG